jgi:hypothetical protein
MEWADFAFVEEEHRFENWAFEGELRYRDRRLLVAASDRSPTEGQQVQQALERCARWVLEHEQAVIAHVRNSLEEAQGLKGCTDGCELDRIVLHHDDRHGELFTAWFNSRRHTPIVFISADDFRFIGEPELHD